MAYNVDSKFVILVWILPLRPSDIRVKKATYVIVCVCVGGGGGRVRDCVCKWVCI